MNKLIYAIALLLIVSCGGGDEKLVDAKSDRSVQYFPNMYESVGYETYQENIYDGKLEAQKPVEGTVNRGWMPYDYEDTNEGYDLAKANLNNPLPYTEENELKGSVMYGIYCAICHGKKGNGKGHLVTTEKILGVPSYDDREITQGSIYHVMYYGINYMGSYASQTSTEERWQIAHHVDKLTRELKKEPAREFEKIDSQEDRMIEAAASGDNDSEIEAVNGDVMQSDDKNVNEDNEDDQEDNNASESEDQ